MTLTRREFLKGSCATAAVGAVAGPSLLFAPSAHAAANGHDTVVHLFLRGGLDGLNLVVPIDGADRTFYEQARPNLAIAATGAYGALPLTLASGAGTGFGLHPSASGLRDLWNAGHLAIVHACGLASSVTRSHFDAQLYIDLGTPGQQGIGSGWMARAMNVQPNLNGAEQLPALGVASRQPAGLLGSVQALTMSSPGDFALNAGAWSWQRTRSDSPAGLRGVNETLGSLWAGSSALELGGQRADRSLQVIARQSYSAAPAGWPNSEFARQLWTIAQSIQFNLGLHYATLDLGGWDTHNGQGTAGSGYHYYQNKIAELSQALAAFYAALDTSGHAPRVTVIVQSEFGRRVRANASGGTDHGYGNPVLVLGGPVNGRRFYGTWSGLDPEILSPHFGDVPVTTDHRQVLSEILIKRMGNNHLATVFPGYANYAPLGLVRDFGTLAKPAPRLRARPIKPAATEQPDLLERLMRYVQEWVD
ncbi:DUF1501 domain-containing protein [Lysobacter antibioticus]|uniref:DUF1501 domain-containing protein n=1 Tax=Lysobacter antibioticus TaxID=84531 RepID=UPI000345A71C|nr:DUF1501 domain-containing protein [Lysobacter antibioticus]